MSELRGQRDVFTHISTKNYLNILCALSEPNSQLEITKKRSLILIAKEMYHPDQVNSGNFDIISLIFI